MVLMISTISLGPVEQLAPIASTPRLSSTIAAVSGSVPYRVLLSSLKVRVAKTGRSLTSLEAMTAALVSLRLIMVSIVIRSTPASHIALNCCLYTSTSSSKSRGPIGLS